MQIPQLTDDETLSDLETLLRTRAKLKDVITALNTLLPHTTNTQVFFDGDSLMRGDHSSNQPATGPGGILSAYFNSQPNFGGCQVFAVNGQKVDDMLNDESSQILNAFDTSTYPLSLIVVGCATNNMFAGEAASSIYAKMKQYHLNAFNSGKKTIALTISYNNWNYGVGVSAFEAIRVEYNKLIRAGWKDDLKASALVDIGSDSHIGVYSSTVDYTYFWDDGCHFNDYGYNYIANLIKPAITAVANGQNYGVVTPYPTAPTETLTTLFDKEFTDVNGPANANVVLVNENGTSKAQFSTTGNGAASTFGVFVNPSTDTGWKVRVTISGITWLSGTGTPGYIEFNGGFSPTQYFGQSDVVNGKVIKEFNFSGISNAVYIGLPNGNITAQFNVQHLKVERVQ